MAIGGGTILSLVLGDRSAVLTQVVVEKTTRTLQRVARFDASEGTRLLDRPAEHGAALATFLTTHGFSAKRAVVGVPARWLIAQERELPPVDTAGAADLLRLAAERLSVAESGTMVADYAGVVDAKNASRVLLVGMLKPQLDRVRQLVEAAGLQLAAVCPTSLAVARMAGGGRNVLRLSDDGAELVLQQGDNPRTLQPLTPDLAALGGELRRTLTMRGAAGAELVLADAVGLSESESSDLASRLATPPLPFGDVLGVSVDPAARNGQADTLPPGAAWPGVALALAAVDKRGLPVDFADTKLAVVPPRRFGRRSVLAAVAAVAAVVGLVWLYNAANAAEAEERDLAGQVAGTEKPVKDATANVAHLNYGRTYFDRRPPLLDCLRELSLALGYGGGIHISQVTFNPGGRYQVMGKADDPSRADQLISEFNNRLQANKNFENVGRATVTEGGTKDVKVKTFSIEFTFVPKAAK